MKITRYFRRLLDKTIDFLWEISSPQYVTKEGQRKIDEFIIKMRNTGEIFLIKLVEDSKR